MTEEEWLVCAEPMRMLKSLKILMERARGIGLSNRPLRLFAAACCRGAIETARNVPELPESDLWGDVRTAEQIADGLRPPMSDLDHHYGFHTLFHRSASTVERVCHAALSPSAWGAATGVVDALDDGIWDEGPTNAGAIYLRDIFGNPFRPVSFSASWLTPTVTTFAGQMYDTRDFSAMPILADALQDAGCSDDQVLTHCRGPGPHVRGCWVADACLSRS